MRGDCVESKHRRIRNHENKKHDGEGVRECAGAEDVRREAYRGEAAPFQPHSPCHFDVVYFTDGGAGLVPSLLLSAVLVIVGFQVMNSILLGAAALGFALRLVFSLGYWIDKPLTKDEREYLSLARSLVRGHGFCTDEELLAQPVEPVGRAPGYPLFLALAGGGRQPAAVVPRSVKIVQSAVGAVGVVLVGLVAAELAGPGAGAAAALIAACYPPLVWISAYALSEVVIWPIGFLLVWSFGRPAWSGGQGGWASCVACGALAGVAALTHPALALFAIFATLWLIRRMGFVPAAVFALGALLVIAPWTVRNYRQYGRIVLIASEGGVTFWTGNHPLARGEGDLAANPDLARDKQALRARYPGLNEEQMEPVYYREALAWIRANPLDWLLLEARKLFYVVVPIGPSYRVHSARYYGASLISYRFAASRSNRRLSPARLAARTPASLVAARWLVRLHFSSLLFAGALQNSRHRSGPRDVRGCRMEPTGGRRPERMTSRGARRWRRNRDA